MGLFVWVEGHPVLGLSSADVACFGSRVTIGLDFPEEDDPGVKKMVDPAEAGLQEMS